MDLKVSANYILQAGTARLQCALGRSGIRDSKTEGDGATPSGCYPLRRVLFREDRLPAPETGLDLAPIRPQDGWCDAPDDPAYNRPVTLPYPASAESLWRDDGLYDVIVVLGHNDDPPLAGRGSAIFMHVARPGYAPTEGCVALAMADLLDVLRQCRPGDRICISAPAGSRK